MKELYLMRPFATRNADEYDLSQILSLFVSPFEGLSTPFDFENTIIKGRMGSGKTMYLRANYAYYTYGLLPSLQGEVTPILPIFIRLSDFQHIKESSEIYRAIIIKVIEELTSAYLRLQDTKNLARVHMGMRALAPDFLREKKLSNSISKLSKLGATEFIERINTELGLKGTIKPKLIELSGEYRETQFLELKKKENPGIRDIEEAYKFLLADQGGKILLMIDEAGSLDRQFFQGKKNSSPFEILMNQLRTSDYIRTKVAIYPNSYQDILTETRYGDIVMLEENIHDKEGYLQFREKAQHLIENYINPEKAYEGELHYLPNSLFELNEKNIYGDTLEQLINASNGNMRRLIQLLDTSMVIAFARNKGQGLVTVDDVNIALRRHSQQNINQYTGRDQDFLEKLMTACRSRSTYKFEFPSMTSALNKFTSRSEEHNVINVIQLGTGRRSTIFAFDYCTCIANEIPTHYLVGSEKIDRTRSLASGRWIPRVARMSETLLEHASIMAKIDGTISYINEGCGFIKGDDEEEYFFMRDEVISEDRSKTLLTGRRVRFIPTITEENRNAYAIEIL